MKSTKTFHLYPIATLCLATLTLAACSGGNSGSSSGSSEEPSTTDTTTSDNLVIDNGTYTGNIIFAGSGSTQIEIKVNDNVDIIVSSESGGAAGNASGSSFTATGEVGYALGTLTCTGSSNYTGTASGTTITGTVEVMNASCTDSISNIQSNIDLDGSFTASLESS